MGISGLPGSGKGIVSDIATEKGAIIVSMGDIVREEAKKRGEGSKETAKNLRKEFGEYIISELTIEKIKKLQDEGIEKTIIVEGIRSLHEVDMFKENFDNFMILSIFANTNIRFERLKKRNILLVGLLATKFDNEIKESIVKDLVDKLIKIFCAIALI